MKIRNSSAGLWSLPPMFLVWLILLEKLALTQGQLVYKNNLCGEPGASIPTTKQRIEEAWGARFMISTTEIGAQAICAPPRKASISASLLPCGD